MLKKCLLTALAVVALSLFPLQGSGSSWKLTRNQDGIKSYARSVPGSKILELKAITVIDARMEVIGEVLRDVPSSPLWVADCSEASIVRTLGRNDMIVHTLLNFPTPVSDRDLVVKSVTSYLLDRARGIITITSVNDPAAPPRRGVVRMHDFSGKYVLEYITREKTGVIYSYRADPGGNLPAFAVNLAGRDSLFKTLKGLKRMTAVPKYIEAAKRSPDIALFENTLRDKVKTRTILKNRLLEQIRDVEIVDYVVKDEEIFRMFVEGDGAITAKIFYSWGSRAIVRDAVKDILRIHLKKYTSDTGAINRVSSDNSVIDSIILGRKAGEPPVIETIRKKLQTVN